MKDQDGDVTTEVVPTWMLLRSALFIVSLAGGLACSGSGEAPATASASGPLTQTIGHRSIPIDVFLMSPSGSANSVTDQNVTDAIAMANTVWAPVNVDYYLGVQSRITTQYLHCLSSAKCSLGSVTWAQIKGDAGLLGVSPTAFPDTNATTIENWIGQISSKRSPTRITVMVGTTNLGGSNCASPYPHDDGYNFNNSHPTGPTWSTDNSHGIICVNDGRGILALAHELGHYLGLFHTHEALLSSALATEGQVPADYYDLVYTGNGAGIRTFSSKADALPYTASFLLKDNGSSRSVNNTVACGDPSFNLVPCEFWNTFTSGNGSPVMYRTSINPMEMAGITSAPVAGSSQYRMNLMSYNFCSKCPLFLSQSQIDIVTRTLSGMLGQRQMLGEPDEFGPTVSSWGAGRLDVFWRSATQNAGREITQLTFANNAWGTTTRVAAPLMESDPTAASWGSGRIDLFWRGADNLLRHNNTTDGSTWGGGDSLSEDIRSSPAVSSWGANRLDVFWRGTDNRLKHKAFDNGWLADEDLGGTLASDPAAVSWASGRLDVFWRGTDSHLKHKWYPYNGAWSWEEDLGGTLKSAPAAASWGSGRLDVFWRGSTDSLRHIWYPYNNGWSWEQDLSGTLTSDPSAVSWGSGRIDVFWASGIRLHHKWYPYNSDWSYDEDLASMQ